MRAAFALLPLTALALGCGDVLPAAEPFASPRILAVAADPPVLEAGPGGVIELIPLVIDGAGNDMTDDPRLELRWRVCDPWRPVNDPVVDCGPRDSVPLGYLGPDQRRAWLTFPLLRALFPPPVPIPDDFFDRPGLCPVAFDAILVPVVLEARFDGYRLLALKWVPIDSDSWSNPAIESLMLEDAPMQEGEIHYFTPGELQRLIVSFDALPPSSDCNDRVVHAYLSDGEVDPPSQGVASSVERRDFSLDLPEDQGATLWLVITNPQTGGVGWTHRRLEPRAP